jgi:hypothetical protein
LTIFYALKGTSHVFQFFPQLLRDQRLQGLDLHRWSRTASAGTLLGDKSPWEIHHLPTLGGFFGGTDVFSWEKHGMPQIWCVAHGPFLAFLVSLRLVEPIQFSWLLDIESPAGETCQAG